MKEYLEIGLTIMGTREERADYFIWCFIPIERKEYYIEKFCLELLH
jgi:hypothetical protein